MGDPYFSSPFALSVGNNAFGVMPCIVASWLLCRPAEAAGKNRIQLFGGLCHRIAQERVLQMFRGDTLVSIVSVCSVGEPLLRSPCRQSCASAELLWPIQIFHQSPRVVRVSAGEKLLVIAATAC